MPRTEEDLRLPRGFHWAVETDFSGWDRPENVVENEAEVRLLFTHGGRPQMVCAYCECACEKRPRNVQAALTWFRGHSCVGTEAA